MENHRTKIDFSKNILNNLKINIRVLRDVVLIYKIFYLLKYNSSLMNEICAICLDDDSNLDLILPCNHKFHSQCILPWLKSNGTCPYCRACPKTSFQAFFSKAFIIPLRIKLEEENLRFSYPNKYHYRIDYKKIRRIYYKKNKVRFEILKKDGTFKFKSFYIKPITQLNLFSSALSYQLNFLANHI